MNKLNIVSKRICKRGDLNVKNMDLTYRYKLLGRLQSDCEYYLNNPNPKHLWSGDVESQIEDMKELFNSFKGSEKPKWITWNDILGYEKKMSNLS
jgi:hypothetical protein